MDLAALVARAESRYRDASNAVVTETGWADYINDAYMDVIAASPLWPFLEVAAASVTVPAGQGSVALPADVFRVSSVFNSTDKTTLAPLTDLSDYLSHFPDPAATLGTPEFYRLRGSTIHVLPWPAVATALSINGHQPPAPLTTSAEPVFPEQYHRMLISGALAYAYEDDGNLKQSQVHGARFSGLLADMKSDLLSSRTSKYPTILDDF